MKKQISITIEEEYLIYLDTLADINGRSRSNMLECIIRDREAEDLADSDAYIPEV